MPGFLGCGLIVGVLHFCTFARLRLIPLFVLPMRIWKQAISVESLTANNANSAVSHLGIEFLEVGDDFIRARMPVDNRTIQPYGLPHGGVAVLLAERWAHAVQPTPLPKASA